jgi:diguanylate cyclase (GGDEF)-like protein
LQFFPLYSEQVDSTTSIPAIVGKQLYKKMDTSSELKAQLDQVIRDVINIRFSDPAQAVRDCLEALRQVEGIHDPSRSLQNQTGRLKLILSGLYLRLFAYDQALAQALDVLTIYQKIDLPSGIARAHNAVGLCNLHLSTYAESLDNLLKALHTADETSDLRLKARVLNNLGLLYLRMEEYPQALSYLEKSLEIAPETKSPAFEADLLENICVAYLNLGQYSLALTHCQKGIALFQEAGNRYGEATALSSAGEIYAAMGHTIDAHSYYHKSLKISDQIEDVQGAAKTHLLIGSLHFKQGQRETALEHLQSALEYAEKSQDTSQISRIHFLLSRIYREMKDFQMSLRHFEQFHDLKEAVFNEDMATKIKSLEIMHHVKETRQDSEIYRLRNVELSREIEERKKAQSELERIITLDPLTSLFNRRHFFELTLKELERSQRYNRPLSVIMLDIDHFKQVNDQFGHLVGDRVIVEVARRIQKALRRIDSACRYGGEEFAVLLPETPLMQAEMVASRLWNLVTRQPTVSGELVLKITVSVGVATFQHSSEITVDDLLDQADQAMYAAKQAGRNRVAVYSDHINGERTAEARKRSLVGEA